MQFYDIHEQTPYKITISRPENPEELSDLFITEEEVKDLVGDNHFHCYGTSPRTVTLRNVISNEVMKWAEKLEESGKKTLPIEDEDLVEVLKEGYLSDFTPETTKYGRHGDRICYAKQFKRVKKKPTQGDVTGLWSVFQYAFYNKYGCYPSHIPRYDRHISMFKAWKKILGWVQIKKQVKDKTQLKFYRQIWDNPEEYIR